MTYPIGNTSLSAEALHQLAIFEKSLLKSIEIARGGNRGWASQTILKQLRDFVECVMFLVIFQKGKSRQKYNYHNICIAITEVKKQSKFRFLWKFHDFLQISVSHYTPDENASERLMLKYYDYLIDIRSYLDKEFNIKTLQYLDLFP